MSTKPKDEADKLRDGELSSDPLADTEPVRLRVVEPGERRHPDEPCDLPAERALLGALLWCGANAPDKVRVGAVADMLESGEMFYGRGLGSVFDAMRACVAAGAEHDPVAVHAQLAAAGRTASIGGIDGLEALKSEASTISERQARIYAQNIRDAWARRCAIRDARSIIETARDPKKTGAMAAECAAAAARAMTARALSTAATVSLRQSAEAFFLEMNAGGTPAFATGLRDLDATLNGGVRPGEVTVLAARPNVGKSALAAQIAEGIVDQDPSLAVLYVTLEMAHKLFAARLISARSGVPLANIRRCALSPTQWSAMTTAIQSLAGKGLYFADSPTQTVTSILAAALERKRALEREGRRLALVVIDHLGLVKPSAEVLKRANREQQVAETSRGQRFIASELGVHVIGIAHIGRESEKGASPLPRLHHLRESGSLENDADAVLILHRDRLPSGKFDNEKPASLVLAKGRMDETANLLLGFDTAHTRFVDWNGSETHEEVYG